MSPVQEAMNAITMTLPSASLLSLLLLSQRPTPMNHAQGLLLFGTLMHLPISFSYHMGAAMGMFGSRLDNSMRRLDQGMQHAMCAAFSMALSGSKGYACANLLINLFFAVQLWMPGTSNDGRRWVPVAACTFFYTLPMLWRGDLQNYVVAVASMAMGGTAFIPSVNASVFGGWGHSIFHCLLAIYARALARSAGQVQLFL